MSTNLNDLDRANELFAFLQGDVPKGFVLHNVPKLDAPTAATVLYVLSAHFKGWCVPDSIERCDVCGDLYDSDEGGKTLNFGEKPYYFCDDCEDGVEYRQKIIETAESMNAQVQMTIRARTSLLAWANAFELSDEWLTRIQVAARMRCVINEALGGE